MSDLENGATLDMPASTPPAVSNAGAQSEADAVLSTVRAAIEQQELQLNRRRTAIAYAFAAIVVPIFSIPDLLFRAVDPTWNLGAMLAIRACVTPLLALAALRLRRRACSATELESWILLAPVLLTAGMTMSVMVTGALDSPYVAGLSLVACGYAFVPRPYRRAIVTGVLVVAMLPVAYLVWVPFSGRGAELLAPRELVRLGTQVAIHATMVGVLIMAAHAIWAIRREMFESRSIGRYRIRNLVGKGGMGEVWAAWDATLKREVAIKVLRTDHHDPVAALRFEREVQATIQLTHPNTVRIFDFGTTEEGVSFYAMELLRGEPLSALVARVGRLSPERAVWLALQVARALAEAHGRGIVHRDIKPENVFVTHAGDESDHVKVLDFGIARLVAQPDAGAALTQTGMVAGTPLYLAPELMMGEKATPASDVYALGVVLFQMLVAEAPSAVSNRGLGLARQMLGLRRPSEIVSSIPISLDDVVMRCLANEASARFASGRGLTDALIATGLADGYRPEIAVAARLESVPPPGDEPTRKGRARVALR